MNILSQDPLLRWHNQPQRFEDRHFDVLRREGICTVRLNLDGFSKMDEADELSSEWLGKLDWVIERASLRGMHVILDEHNQRQCGKDADACQRRLIKFWKQMSAHYKDAPPNVIFEILNEPNSKITPELWNALLKESLAEIRHQNPQRNVIVGPASWNHIPYLDQLDLPPDDEHIIVTVHYYIPVSFTNQGVTWKTGGKPNPTGIHWGGEHTVHQIDRDFSEAQRWATRNNRPIFLGEFGSFDAAPLSERALYAAAVARAAEARGWPWAYWQFDSNFRAYDMDEDRWLEPIRAALAPPGSVAKSCGAPVRTAP